MIAWVKILVQCPRREKEVAINGYCRECSRLQWTSPKETTFFISCQESPQPIQCMLIFKCPRTGAEMKTDDLFKSCCERFRGMGSCGQLRAVLTCRAGGLPAGPRPV